MNKEQQQLIFVVFQKYGEVTIRSITLEIEEQQNKNQPNKSMIENLHVVNDFMLAKQIQLT